MKNVLDLVRNLLRYHKLKFVSVFLFALIFAVLIFPYNDLRDIITRKISEATDKSVYLQFKSMSLAFPLGLHVEDVLIETPSLPTLSARSMTLVPGFLGLLTASPSGSVSAEGLFKGSFEASLKSGDKTKAGVRKQVIDVAIEKIALQSLSEFLRSAEFMSLVMQGSLSMKTNVQVDPNFETQPGGTVDVRIASFVIPNPTVQTPLGPFQMPTMKWDKFNLKGKMADGRLVIEDLTIGDAAKDEIFGKVTGSVNLAFRGKGAQARPEFSGYDLKLDLSVKNSFVENNRSVAPLFDFIGKYKTPSGDSSRYALSIAMAPGQMQPTMKGLNE